VLGNLCACGASARFVAVTPPGDARPAFPDDIAHVNKIYEMYFGVPLIPDGYLVLLNKVPDNDRMEEIVVGGAIVGAIRYLPEKHRWEALPRREAYHLMKPTKGFIIIDDSASQFIENGASVLAPGVKEIPDGILVGDEVFILTESGACAGVGRARVDSGTGRKMEKGSLVKTRKPLPSQFTPGTATWKDAVAANREHLERTWAASGEFIRSVIEKNPDLPITVSYSGGKDSLATLLMVLKHVGQVPLMYIDTGLEFEATEKNVIDISDKYDLFVHRIFSGERFWEEFSKQGPPSQDQRWCCRVCKLEPIREYISKHFGECISFIGQRKYESFSRMKNPRVWRNAYVKVQLSAAPIHNWTALHVWLTIFSEEAPYNTVYREQVDRIGCYMCPASDLATIVNIKARYPDLWREWQEKMEEYQAGLGLSDEWLHGGWRNKERFERTQTASGKQPASQMNEDGCL
jgi:phosphoadenosine phosphosulfate reductase